MRKEWENWRRTNSSKPTFSSKYEPVRDKRRGESWLQPGSHVQHVTRSLYGNDATQPLHPNYQPRASRTRSILFACNQNLFPPHEKTTQNFQLAHWLRTSGGGYGKKRKDIRLISRAAKTSSLSVISLYSSNRPAKFLIGTLPSRYTPKTIYMWGYKLSQPPSHCWAPWRWKFDYRRERVLLSPPEMGLSICQSLTWNSHHTRRDPNTCCMLPRRLPFYNGGGLRNQTVCEWEDSFSSSYFFLYDIPIGARTPGISWASFLSVSFGRPFSLHLCGNELIDKGNRTANRLFVWNMKKNKI